jgi:two-component system, NarL family, nitrate/nitrite response regulator NarL
MYSVVIASPTRLYRDGLAALLKVHGEFEVRGTAASAEEAMCAAAEFEAACVILDSALPRALEATRSILRFDKDVVVLALGLPDTEADILAFAEAGIAGYLGQDGTLDDLAAAIRSALRGELHCSPQVAGQLLRRLASRAAASADPDVRRHLTAREAQVLDLIERRLSNKEIAGELGIEVATVKNHVHNLFDKLQVHRRSEAVRRSRGAGRLA